MSIRTPVIPTLILKGLEAKIQIIQLNMVSGLSWLSKSFGLADRIVEMKDSKPFIFPAAFESNVKSPISMLPCDVWSSFAFWIKNSEAKFDFDDNFPPKNPLLIYDVSCIFYMDIHKIDNTMTYKETKSKLIEDIFHFFNTLQFPGMLIAKKFIEDDITKVYEGFTLDQFDNRFKMYPKWACRLDFELSFRDSCYSGNNYSLITGSQTADTTYYTADNTLITADTE
jgi:hypothetical protein